MSVAMEGMADLSVIGELVPALILIIVLTISINAIIIYLYEKYKTAR